jgi:two-component system chemotaxis sensor kinase CheA
VRSIRRIVHTLKGDAAACGCRELSELAHEFEDVLAGEGFSAGTSLAEAVFTATDVFAALLKAYRRKSKLPSVEPLRKLVQALAREQKSLPPKRARKKAKTSLPATWSEYEKLAMQQAAQQGRNVYHFTVRLDPHCAMPIAGRQLVLNAMAPLGEVLGTRPETGSTDAARKMEVLFASDQPVGQLATRFHIPTITSEVQQELLLEAAKPSRKEPAKAVETPAMEPLEASAPAVPVPSENILRVDAERIDNVLNLVGELIIGKSMLQQAMNEFSRRFPKDPARARFADAMAFQSRVLSDLQRSVMKVRMVPVEQLFRRFPRLVRDVAKHCDKQVELTLSGQDTDLDKSLLDAITEPLTHLVRNAVSHGIESAAEREKAGKPAHGTIHLKAYHQGNQVVVEVSDDGHGVDVRKVRERALQNQLVSAEEASGMSEADLLSLVFRPGFSTAEEITEISGRGVGLDVVQSVLQRMKGSVELENHPGRGTTFRLKLPLTLAIIKALLFRVEHKLYAIPLNAVAEIARARQSDLHRVDHYEVLQLRDQVLPLIRLGRTAAEDHKIFVLVIHMGERKLGLIVDSLEGEEELVIKALDDQAVATDLISGASILGDGRVVLILHLPALVERFAKARPQEAGAMTSGLLLSHAERHSAGAIPAVGGQA